MTPPIPLLKPRARPVVHGFIGSRVLLFGGWGMVSCVEIGIQVWQHQQRISSFRVPSPIFMYVLSRTGLILLISAIIVSVSKKCNVEKKIYFFNFSLWYVSSNVPC